MSPTKLRAIRRICIGSVWISYSLMHPIRVQIICEGVHAAHSCIRARAYSILCYAHLWGCSKTYWCILWLTYSSWACCSSGTINLAVTLVGMLVQCMLSQFSHIRKDFITNITLVNVKVRQEFVEILKLVEIVCIRSIFWLVQIFQNEKLLLRQEAATVS